MELALPFPAEPALNDPPRGDEDVEDPLACGWSWGKAGKRSLDTADLGAYWELYQVSTGPRAWTDEMDGSSRITVLMKSGKRVRDDA